jgi:UDP-glucose 4-epimerase
MSVSVLRFAPLFGPGVRTFYTSIFDKRVVPVLMGYDPLVQLLHPDDALAACELVLQKPVSGVFNIAPTSSIPLQAALHLADKIPVPVPHPVAYAASEMLWATGLAEAPGAFVDYVRFLFVADGSKAQCELGFTARHSSREALRDYLSYRYPGRSRQAAEVHP